MELQQLRYVLAVAETTNFTRAAERCHVVQSALSHQVKRLEHELGTPLFARTSRRVRLTPAGEAFLPAARQCLESADRAAADAAAAAGEVRGRLRVGVIPTVAAVDVPAALRDLRTRHPAVRVSLRTGASDELAADVAETRLDVAFLGLADSAAPKGVLSHELARDELVLVLSPGHRHRSARRVRLEQMAAETFVDFPAGSPGRTQTDRAFAARALERDVAFEVSDAGMMARLVRNDLAIGFLPRSFAEFAPELAGLPIVQVASAPRRVEYVVWNALGPSPAAAAFLAGIGVAAQG